MEPILAAYRTVTMAVGVSALLVAGAAGAVHLLRRKPGEGSNRVPHFGIFIAMMALLFVGGGFAFYPGGEGIAIRRAQFLGGMILVGVAMAGWLLAFAPKEGIPDPEPLKAGPLLSAFAAACVVGFGFNVILRPEAKDEFLLLVGGGNLLALGQLAAYAMVAAIAEEIIFRGVLFRMLFAVIGKLWPTIVISALLWAFVHAGVEPLLGKHAQILLLGLIYGWARWRFGIGAAILLHVGNNALALILFLPSLR